MGGTITSNGSVIFTAGDLKVHFDKVDRVIRISTLGPDSKERTETRIPFDVGQCIRVLCGLSAQYLLQFEFSPGETIDLCQSNDRDLLMRVAWHLGDITRCAVEVDVRDASPIGDPVTMLERDREITKRIQNPVEPDTLEESLSELLGLDVPPGGLRRLVAQTLEDDEEITDRPFSADAGSDAATSDFIDTEEELGLVSELATPIERPTPLEQPFEGLISEARAALDPADTFDENVDWWEAFEIDDDSGDEIDRRTPTPQASAKARAATPRARYLVETPRPGRIPVRRTTSSYRVAKPRVDSSSGGEA